MWQKSIIRLQFALLERFSPKRCVATTQTLFLNQKWRRERGLSLNPNACGLLTDGPDYTFLDGRPTPYGVRQKLRILKQQELAEHIIKLTEEVDFAVERHKWLQQKEDDRQQEILTNKLKPKGIRLLKKQ